MPELDRNGIRGKAAEQPVEIAARFFGVFEARRKLREDGAEAPALRQRSDARAKQIEIVAREIPVADAVARRICPGA